MASGVFLTLILCFASMGQGLELTLTRDVQALPGKRSSCGVLQCVEGHGNHATSKGGSLRSVNVFRRNQNTSTNGRLGRCLVSLTSQRPRLLRVTDGVKIDGRLAAGRATVRLELFKQEDCQAEFSCRITSVDAQGREHVTTSHLVQQPEMLRSSQPDLTASLNWQLLTLVQQLNTKLALVGQSVEDLEARVEKSLETDSFERLLVDKIDALENRMEDKIENSVSEKLCQLDARVSALSSSVAPDPKLETEASSESNVNTSKGDVKMEQGNSLADVSCERIEKTVNSTSLLLSSLQNNFTSLQACERDDSDLLNHMKDELRQFFTAGESVASHAVKELLDSHDNLGQHINRVNDGTLSSLQKLFDTNSGIARQLASLTNIVAPKTCKKGMVSFLTRSSYPHVVVVPEKEGPLHDPYLCDAATDGGGWIVIQRRATGNVDFYRDWAAYRRGFGSVDDDFWLGNENIHALTKTGNFELRVELIYKGKSVFANYKSFSLGNEKDNYRLRLGAYEGTAGDSLTYHSGKPFSTFDRENDVSSFNCAERFTGAWWYYNCLQSNLNGVWKGLSLNGPVWSKIAVTSVSYSEMKIRRVD